MKPCCRHHHNFFVFPTCFSAEWVPFNWDLGSVILCHSAFPVEEHLTERHSNSTLKTFRKSLKNWLLSQALGKGGN